MDLDCTYLQVAKVRYDTLFRPYEHFIRDQRVLELAPLVGLFTNKFLLADPASLMVIENGPEALNEFRFALSNALDRGQVQLNTGDLHQEIFKIEPGSIDTVICAGFLYHTPHVPLVLEGMARLQPQYIFIESFDAPKLEFYTEPVNQHSHLQCHAPSILESIKVPRQTIVNWMRTLGYKINIEIDKKNIHLPDNPKLSPTHEAYFRLWAEQYSIWFERISN